MSAPHRQVWNGDRSVYQLAADVRRAWNAAPCRWRLRREGGDVNAVIFWLADGGDYGGDLEVTADGQVLVCPELRQTAKRDIDAAEALARVSAALGGPP